VNADRPDPHGTGTVRPDIGPTPRPANPAGSLAGRVSRLDRVTLQLGVAVAVVIACCSYAVSATSLYALGRSSGYSWWQAAAVPVVADGPAIYGMFRIISRSRRGARGAGYGWLLVTCGTVASIAGNVAHAHPNPVAQGIAAAIPLAVLAMLEGLKGDAGEVTRMATPAPADLAAIPVSPNGAPATSTTLRRVDPPATAAAIETVPELPGSTASPAAPVGGLRARLQATYAQGRADGQPWTARSLAQAAGCGRSSAAAFLQRHRHQAPERSP
jgi:Protein of unknown function (DUF2637)